MPATRAVVIYQRGSKGPEVARIQERLKDLEYYRGPVDGDFGGGTEAAVRVFQRSTNLDVDGKVGQSTWARLFDGTKIMEPAIAHEPLPYRCLALTGSFETSTPVPECFAGLSGDFDGQGLSFGALQWNIGQGTLQPLLLDMEQTHLDILEDIFADQLPVLRAVLQTDRDEQLAWARSIQDLRRFAPVEPWRGMFKTLGRCTEFQQIQTEHANALYHAAVNLCANFGIRSERACALMFDIKVQNGDISAVVRAQIERDFRGLEGATEPESREEAQLRIIANRRAEATRPQWVEDVRVRKLTIANGQGVVHGRLFDLERQYAIGLRSINLE